MLVHWPCGLGAYKDNGRKWKLLYYRVIQGLYWGYIGILEKKTEATTEVLGFRFSGVASRT